MTIEQVIADMRKHQDHIQMGACIKGWCDALAAAPDAAEKCKTDDSFYNLKCEHQEDVIADQNDTIKACLKQLKERTPSPGTIAAADVAAVLDKEQTTADLYKALRALIAAAGEGEPVVLNTADLDIDRVRRMMKEPGVITPEPVMDTFICAECNRKHTIGEVLGPVVPLVVVEQCAWVLEQLINAYPDDSWTDAAKYTLMLLTKYRPAAKEPCATCNDSRFTQAEPKVLPSGADNTNMVPCTDCQPQEPPDEFAEGLKRIDRTIADTARIQQQIDELKAKQPTPPPTYAQRAQWWIKQIDPEGDGIEDSPVSLALCLAGHNDDAVLKWLQAPGDEEVEWDE